MQTRHKLDSKKITHIVMIFLNLLTNGKEALRVNVQFVLLPFYSKRSGPYIPSVLWPGHRQFCTFTRALTQSSLASQSLLSSLCPFSINIQSSLLLISAHSILALQICFLLLLLFFLTHNI